GQAGLDASSVSTLLADPRQEGLLYALALLTPLPSSGPPGALPDVSLRVSQDAGASWREVGALPPLQRLIADPASPGAAYALANPVTRGVPIAPAFASTALFHTADADASWQSATSLPFAAFDIAASPTAPRTLFAVGYEVPPHGGP